MPQAKSTQCPDNPRLHSIRYKGFSPFIQLVQNSGMYAGFHRSRILLFFTVILSPGWLIAIHGGSSDKSGTNELGSSWTIAIGVGQDSPYLFFATIRIAELIPGRK
ncbi:unnamed protein product [Schistosoma mattheei]|uniref:Uncharacterized protein n=1 Tax=Schistosoma mattheei TaxID=31246 RepID=A0A183NTG8_9TREM|nr:unnamed protein product [Schistosoma mattheei]